MNFRHNNCQIKEVVVDYCPLGYFSTMIITPALFRITCKDFVYFVAANSISIEEDGESFCLYFELDGATILDVYTSEITKIDSVKLTKDDLRQVRRELNNFFSDGG